MRFGLLIVAVYLAANPFGWDQAGPLRFSLVSTIGFATIAASLGAGDSRPQPLPRWAVLGWTITLVGLVASTALSQDPWHALIGTPERHFGLATWLLLAGLFSVASMYPNSIVPFVTNAILLGAIGAGTWSLLETQDVAWFASSFAGDRIGGPFLQPAYLGAAMVLAAPVCIGVAVDPARSQGLRSIATLASLLAMAALGFSQSRGAWVAFVVVLIATLVQRRMVRTGIAAIAAIGLVIAFTPIGARAASLVDSGGVVAGRIDEWQVGSRAVTDTPTFGITGHGPEGYRIVFGQHVDDDYVIDHGREVFTDRAHNVVLDTILAGGFIAGIGLLLLYGGLAITALQRLKADDLVDVAFGAAVLGSLAQQLVLFPLAELDPALWIVAGLLVARRPSRDVYRPPLFRYVSESRRIAMLATGFAAAIAAIAGVSDVAADRAVANSVSASSSDDSLSAVDMARSRRPDSIRYDFVAARTASTTGELDGFRAAQERLEDGLAFSPNDPALRIEHATMLLEVARRSNDQGDLALALTTLEELATTSEPRHPDVLMRYGIAQALSGDPDGAAESLERATALDPTDIDPILNLAIVELERGNLDRGEDLLDQIAELAPANATAQQLRQEFLSK